MRVRVWARRYNPFILGGNCERLISTYVEIDEFALVECRGFKIFEVTENDKTMVFELESGGYCGDAIEEVVQDIHACSDLAFMQKQVQDMKIEGQKATAISYEEFFKTRR